MVVGVEQGRGSVGFTCTVDIDRQHRDHVTRKVTGSRPRSTHYVLSLPDINLTV